MISQEKMQDYLTQNIYSSGSNEWYTPLEFIKAARRVLGTIELDPASCELANQVVRAEHIYTQENNGLTHQWIARTVWLNPPYGRLGADRQKGQTELWINYLIDQYTKGNVQEAILLVNAYLYKLWFAPLWQYPICFPKSRLAFWNAKGEHGRSPHSSALVYFGDRQEDFVEEFSQFGPVVKVVTPRRKKSQQTLWESVESEVRHG